MAKREDLTGQVFGRWTVKGFSHLVARRTYWNCLCECGKERPVVAATLKNGASRSCGCLIGEAAKKRLTKHGMADSKLYMIWGAMMKRCNTSTDKSYAHYGGRGIKVCERWHNFPDFYADMGPTWIEGWSIERLNVNGDYCPENCIWIPRGEQSKNRRPSSQWVRKNGRRETNSA